MMAGAQNREIALMQEKMAKTLHQRNLAGKNGGELPLQRR